MVVIRLLCVLFLVSVSSGAWAGPPFVTDDPETPAIGGWEINLPYILQQQSPTRVTLSPLFDLNYGYKSHIALSAQSGITNVSGSGLSKATGFGDTNVGVTWRFQEETSDKPQLALYPQVSLPTGSATEGLGAGKPSYILPLLAEKTWGNWTGFSNVGYVKQTASGSRDYWYYGAALLREVNDRLMVGAELYGNSPADTSSGWALAYNVGTEYSLSKERVLLFSIGHSLDGSAGPTAYLGIQMVLGPKHAKHHHHPGRTGVIPAE